MEQKRAGIPLIALIIFFVLIVGIIVTCLIILFTRRTTSDTTKIQASSNTSGTNELQNAVVNDIEQPTVDDTGEEVSVNSEDIINVYKLAGNYDTAAKYAIYQSGGFDASSIDNELKLKLAFAQLTEDELSSGNVTKSLVEEKLQAIFGTSDGVTMQTVVMLNDYNFKTDYNIISFDYNEAEETFTVTTSSVNATDPSFVTEIVDKAISYSDRLEIYVTPLYVQVGETTQNDTTVTAYSIYSSYDFSSSNFENLLIPVLKESYYNAILNGDSYDIDKINYDVLQENVAEYSEIDIASLGQYKYTFTLSGDTYTLSSFSIVTEEDEDSEDTSEENNENTDANLVDEIAE